MQMDSLIEDRMKVALIGTSGAGKTCFIAAMRWLGDCGADARFISVGANGDTKKYFDDLHEKVKEGEVPPGTPKEFELPFSERYAFCDGMPPAQIDFSMRDFKGGDLHDIDADSALFQSWAQSDLLVVLIDIEKVKRQGVELQDNLRDLLAVLIRNEMKASQKRLAIVITQADKGGFTKGQHSPEAAEKLLDENLHDFFERIQTCGFKETKCFLLASIGLEPEKDEEGKSKVPEVDGKREWRPFGYEELFDWICAFQRQEEISRFYEGLWTKVKPYVAALAVLIIGGVIWCGVVFHKYRRAVLVYNNQTSTQDEKANATWNMRDKDRIEIIEERIEGYLKKAEAIRDDGELRILLSREKSFFDKAKISQEQRKRVDKIDNTIANKLEDSLLAQITDAMNSEDYHSASNLIVQYRGDRIITKKHQNEVNGYSTTLVVNKRTRDKSNIAKYDVGEAGNTQRMREKLKMIRGFYRPDSEDIKAAHKAADAMDRLMHGSFEITQISAEGLEKKRNTYVLIATGVGETTDLKQYKKDGEGVPVETKIIDSNCPQWNDERLLHAKLTWKPGQSIRVEWRRDSKWSDKCIASMFSINEWVGLLEILKPHAKMRYDGYGNLNNPEITISCDKFPDPEEDLRLIERYVIPGTYWTEPEQ